MTNLRHFTTPRILLAVAMLAVGALTPALVHHLGMQCWIYLPAHVVPLLAGLVLGARWGLLIGAGVGLADLLWGGALVGPHAYRVLVELTLYGGVAGLLRPSWWRFDRGMLALVGAMFTGRIAYLVMALADGRELAQSLRGLFVRPWPGILLQLLLLPLVATWLSRYLEAKDSAPAERSLLPAIP